MKLSVSLPQEDLDFLDAFAQERGIDSRSAAIQKAIDFLRESQLGPAYAEAWKEWLTTSDSLDWDLTAHDGLER
jgi:Arc/MetJ-type ribon-helix-helix transcriptional regulator